MRGNAEKCYSCDEPNPIYFSGDTNSAKDCVQQCTKRRLNGYHDSACSFDLCGQGIFKDKPLTGHNGVCYSCDEPSNIWMIYVNHEGCDMCPTLRNKYNDYCVPKCPAEKPLRGSDNNCYACDTQVRVPVYNMTDACYECPNDRKLNGNECVLK